MNRLRRTHANTAHTAGVSGSGVLGAGARNGFSRLVTTALRNPTTPITGVASWAVGVTGAETGVVLSASRADVSTGVAVFTERDVGTADGCAPTATTLTAETDVVDDGFAVTALSVTE